MISLDMNIKMVSVGSIDNKWVGSIDKMDTQKQALNTGHENKKLHDKRN